MKTFFKRLLGLGALAAMGYAMWRAYERRKVNTGVSWDPQPFPYPPQPHTEAPSEPAPPLAPIVETSGVNGWVAPNDGACPTTHPVKAKLTSGIFHVPGGSNYARTNPDRCYTSPEAAEGDGLRPARR
jgi:hypothetical protein